MTKLIHGLGMILLVISISGCSNSRDLLAKYEGNVLVLLMGTSGCSGTEEATRFLTQYSKERPEGVSIARFDVPAGCGTPGKPADWNTGFDFEIDCNRRVADKLEFFFYPTLYILDQDGEVRYCGGCDPERVPEVVGLILNEKPGDGKKIYSPVMLSKGEAALDFTASSIDGKKISFHELKGDAATLLVFSSTTCPFSAAAIADLPSIQDEFQGRGLSSVIVHVGGSHSPLKDFYQAKTPGIPVVVDRDGKISKENYGIMGVPFYYLFDKEGRVTEKLPFTAASAREAVDAYLGGRQSRAGTKARSGAG